MKHLLFALVLIAPAASAEVMLVRSSVTPVGTVASSGPLTLCASAGEAQAGTTSSSGSLVLVSGFWAGLDKNYVPCLADLDGNGVLNIDDLDVFVAAFLSGDPVADFDGNGALNIDDIDAFVTSFLAGCE